jgi:hypothetical protein
MGLIHRQVKAAGEMEAAAKVCPEVGRRVII